MNNLHVNLFCSPIRRFSLSFKNINELICCGSKNVRIRIIGTSDVIDLWESKLKDYTGNNDIPVELVGVPTHEYNLKVKIAHQTDCKYSCKLDDDVLISRHVWKYILENLNKINIKNPIISPILTNGMSSVDLFIEDFLSDNKKQIAKEILLRNRVRTHAWGLNFRGVNDYISNLKKWDGEEYWKFIRNYDNGWKQLNKPDRWVVVLGVHPARFSYEYNKFIADEVISNQSKFFGCHEYRLEKFITPYFTNNMFVSETDFWIDTFKSFEDSWDEGQLTVRMWEENSTPLYIRNGFGIHMAYGCTEKQLELENYYTNMLNR